MIIVTSIFVLSLVCGYLSAIACTLSAPARWFRGVLEVVLYIFSLTLWFGLVWAVFFAWPFIEKGLVG